MINGLPYKKPSTEFGWRIDALIDAQMHTLDFAERKKAFDEVQAIMAEELPMIYTVSPSCYAAIRGKIGNLRPSFAHAISGNLEYRGAVFPEVSSGGNLLRAGKA